MSPGAFTHPCAAERARCPRFDGHYVPKRCQPVFFALRAATDWSSYDRLVVDRLQHTRHERKLRELRELNTEYDAAGRVIWDLVLTRKAPHGPHNEFLYNRSPRPLPAVQPAADSVRSPRPMATSLFEGAARRAEADILDLLGV